MVETIRIGGRKIGLDHPCFVIAEAGVNHNGNLETAKRLVDVAKKAGADAVKFQTFRAEALASASASKVGYQAETTGGDESQLEMLKKLELSLDDHYLLKAYCDEQDILFLSTPFDEVCADFLDTLGVPVFKIASGELNNPFLLSHIAGKKKPVIVSTGMGTLDEVEAAVRTIRETGNRQIILLHCVSQYPTDPRDANLRAMETMRGVFKVPVGFSDHTMGVEVAMAAAALGASVIEKHFTLDRTSRGPDHRVSLEPAQLKQMIQGIRIAEQALGNGLKEPCAADLGTARLVRRSLVATKNIPKGARLALEWVAVKRPGTGLPPAMLPRLVGLKVKKNIPSGTLLSLEMFDE